MIKKQWLRRISVLVALVFFITFLPLIYPQLLFAYKLEKDQLAIHSDHPIPLEEGEWVLDQVRKKLDASPLQLEGPTMRIYIPESHWRLSWLWVLPPKEVGGFVVVPLSRRNAFLSGADYKTNELIAPTGYRPLPPRTLAYYGAHELTHLAIARKVGWFTFYRVPVWVNEGFADYAALPREGSAALYAAVGEGEASLALMSSHGVYAPYRLLVTYFLEDEGWSVDQLLESRLTVEEARAIAFPKLRQQHELIN